MVNKLVFGVFLASILAISFAYGFDFNGTVYDINGAALNNSNVSVAVRDASMAFLWTNYTTTNSSGWFNLSLLANEAYMYQLSIIHVNASRNFVDYVGQSVPAFPYAEFSTISNPTFYLKEAGTINITVRNSSNVLTTFTYQIKDTTLGYSTGSCSNSTPKTIICYVPKDRNYSIMVYPGLDKETNFVPVSFNWNNFSSTFSYNITDRLGQNYSFYNATTSVLQKQFNISESFARITGYINSSYLNPVTWKNFTIVPYLLEPGNMVSATYGLLPWNVSAWYQSQSDSYNENGFYNISLPYSSAETVSYMLYAAAQNGSFYGGYRNISVTSGVSGFNFSMYGLLGAERNITMSKSTGGSIAIYTKKQAFNLVNASSNQSLTNLNAHIETTVDYSSYGAIEFTFMEDISPAGSSVLLLPLLNITGIKEMNVFSMSFAPKKVSSRSVAQLIDNSNVSMAPFNPQALDGTVGSSISIALYKSNSSCDIPGQEGVCLLTSANMGSFNPLSYIIGGGKLSFRMGLGDVVVHYVNVDLLASGPPDALFEDNADVSETSSGGFGKAMKFGSQGPKIYDYVLVSLPYTEGSSSTTGLNESSNINISVSKLYDENWNVIWDTSLNGSSGTGLAGNNSYYSARSTEWGAVMTSTNCTRTALELSSTMPCYVDIENNKIWVRLPHFSGTAPSISGKVITADAAASDDSSNSGVGTVTLSFWANTQALTTEQFNAGFTKEYPNKYRVSFKVGSDTHYAGVVALTSSTVTVNISSTPQQAVFNVGDEQKFEVDADSYYDVYVKLNSILNNKANLTVKYIHESIPSLGGTEEDVAGADDGSLTGGAAGADSGGLAGILTYVIIIIVVIAVVLAGIWFYFTKFKKGSKHYGVFYASDL